MNKIQKIILAMSMMLAGSALSDTGVGNWVLDDSIVVSIHRNSSSTDGRFLYIECSSKNSTGFVLSFRKFVRFNVITGVDMRKDKDKAQRITMHEFSDRLIIDKEQAIKYIKYGLVIDKEQAIKYIKSLFGGKKLSVRAYPRSGNFVDAEFDITGIENAIKPIREACNW